MKKIKMIGLDLDGTLLNDKKELTSHTREILTRALDQGVTVLVATGRPVTGIPEDVYKRQAAVSTTKSRIVMKSIR